MQRAAALVALAIAHRVTGHGILVSPAPRVPNPLTGIVPKLTSFDDARRVANRGCGDDSAQIDPGIIQPPAIGNIYRPGSMISVQWRLTIPHEADVRDSGVRIALYTEPGDSFECNILAGGLIGDPDFDTPKEGEPHDSAVSAGSSIPGANAPPNDVVTALVQLPNKTCDYCVLQWVWAARSDGGFYISCADIAITETGLLPNYAALPLETGNKLPQNQPSRGYGCSVGGGGAAGGAAIAVVVILVLIAIAYVYFKQKGGGGGGGGGSASTQKYAASTPSGPPGAPPPGGGGGGMPPGWTESVDPASGQKYYVNQNTGETQWTKPAAPGGGGGGRPAPPPHPSVVLPAGWTSAVDPGSGATYYVNQATGQTSWTKP